MPRTKSNLLWRKVRENYWRSDVYIKEVKGWIFTDRRLMYGEIYRYEYLSGVRYRWEAQKRIFVKMAGALDSTFEKGLEKTLQAAIDAVEAAIGVEEKQYE